MSSSMCSSTTWLSKLKGIGPTNLVLGIHPEIISASSESFLSGNSTAGKYYWLNNRIKTFTTPYLLIIGRVMHGILIISSMFNKIINHLFNYFHVWYTVCRIWICKLILSLVKTFFWAKRLFLLLIFFFLVFCFLVDFFLSCFVMFQIYFF